LAFLAGPLALIFGDIRFLSRGADSTHANFRWRARPCRIRDYASKLVSDVTTVRFTPFWPKLRLSMSIGKTSKHSGNRRPADVGDGATAPELCPAGPSRRSAFTRIQTRVAMHAMCLLPSCGADAEGLSATTFDAQISTFVGLG